MYIVTKSNFKNEETEYTSYGIALLKSGCAEILLPDISPNIGFVNSIVEKCNAFDAAPEHIMDIVYDSIE